MRIASSTDLYSSRYLLFSYSATNLNFSLFAFHGELEKNPKICGEQRIAQLNLKLSCMDNSDPFQLGAGIVKSIKCSETC